MKVTENTRYLIRKKGFLYDDQYLYPSYGFGTLEQAYDNLNEAKANLKLLHQEFLSGTHIFEYEPPADWQVAVPKLSNYLLQEFNQEILANPANPKDFSLMESYSFPKDLTPDQADKILSIWDISKYELIEVKENEPTFWGIQFGISSKRAGQWVCAPAHFMGERNDTGYDNEIPVFYASEEQALQGVKKRLYQICYALNDSGYYGSFYDLTEVPEILKALIEKDRAITYLEEEKRLKIESWVGEENFIALNGILQEKMFEIIPFPIEEALKLGNEWTPDM